MPACWGDHYSKSGIRGKSSHNLKRVVLSHGAKSHNLNSKSGTLSPDCVYRANGIKLSPKRQPLDGFPFLDYAALLGESEMKKLPPRNIQREICLASKVRFCCWVISFICMRRAGGRRMHGNVKRLKYEHAGRAREREIYNNIGVRSRPSGSFCVAERLLLNAKQNHPPNPSTHTLSRNALREHWSACQRYISHWSYASRFKSSENLNILFVISIY